MSLAARCNHCHTVFRITGAQLAAAQGWVRCGGCSQVFDAAANLVTPSGQPLEVPTVTTQDMPPASAAETEATPQPQAPAPLAPVPAPVPAQQAPAPVFQPMPDIDLNLPDLGTIKTEPAWAPAPPPAATGTATAQTTAPPATAALASPAPAPSMATGRGLGLLLLVTLCLLLAYAARGHIAQALPAVRPVVVQACQALGCQLPPVRQLQALRLQGSSLSRDDTSGHHQLRVQLLNAGDAPLHMPAFDFSLVDAQGEVLARRMIDAAEMQPVLKQLDPGVDTALTLTLDLKALEPAAIGSFRVQPFYP
jgi:predicted Zn finger-like uncharacterized protein